MFQFLRQVLAAKGQVWGGTPDKEAKPQATGSAPPAAAPSSPDAPLAPQQAVAQIFGGLGSWFTDQEAVEGALVGQSDSNAARIDNAFSARAGQNLATSLSEELSPQSLLNMASLVPGNEPPAQSMPAEPAGMFEGFIDADRAEQAYQQASKQVDQLSEAEKQDPENPVMRRYNEVLTMANALRDPDAQVTDAQAEFSGMVAAQKEADRKAAEDATAGKPQLDPDAARRQAEHEAEQEAVRQQTEQREQQRAAIEAQSGKVRELARDEAGLERQIREAMKAGDTAAEEAAVAEIQAKEAERKQLEAELAAARARLEQEERAEAEKLEQERQARKQADDDALARSQQQLADAQAAAAERAAAEEAERRKAGDAAIADKTDKDLAAEQTAEEQKRADMAPADRELYDLSKQAEADLANATKAYEALDEKAKQDPGNEVVRAYNDTLTRANGLRDPDAPVVDAQAEFTGMVAAQGEADRQAEEARNAGVLKEDPEAAARRAQGEAELAEQRAKAEAAEKERAAIDGMEGQLRELGREDQALEARAAKMREHGDEAQEQQALEELRRVEAERRELEARLAAARAEMEARQQAEAAAADEARAREEAEREAKLEAQRQRAAEIEAQRAAESAAEDAGRLKELDQKVTDKTAADLAAEQVAEEQKLAGMDPSDRELYQLGKQAEAELREQERAVAALTEAEKQNPDHPVMQAYNAALTRANAFQNPEAPVEDMEASFRGTVAAEQDRVAQAELDARAGQKMVDPEAEARRAAAEAEFKAQREAAERAEARRQAIAAGERELRELGYQDQAVERRIAQAQADGDELAVEDFAAKLREIEAARQQIEKQIEEAKAQQKAEEEEAARKAEQLRLDEETRKQAALDKQEAAKQELGQRDDDRRGDEEAERMKAFEQQRQEKERADAEAERLAEEQKLAGMDEGERTLYLAEKEKQRELDAAWAAVQALPEHERTLDHPLMKRYEELNNDFNSFSDPNARSEAEAFDRDMRTRVEAELQAAADEARSQPQLDRETVARRVAAAVEEQARMKARLEGEAKLDQLRGEVKDLGKQESEINSEFDRLAALEKKVLASAQPEAAKKQILAQLDAKYDELTRAINDVRSKKGALEKKLQPPPRV